MPNLLGAALEEEPPNLSAAFASFASTESMLTLIGAVSVVLGAVAAGAGSFVASGSDGDGNGSAMAVGTAIGSLARPPTAGLGCLPTLHPFVSLDS